MLGRVGEHIGHLGNGDVGAGVMLVDQLFHTADLKPVENDIGAAFDVAGVIASYGKNGDPTARSQTGPRRPPPAGR